MAEQFRGMASGRHWRPTPSLTVSFTKKGDLPLFEDDSWCVNHLAASRNHTAGHCGTAVVVNSELAPWLPICTICADAAGPGDFVQKVFVRGIRSYRFPIQQICGTGCGGITGAIFFGYRIDAGRALNLAMFEHGTGAANHDNPPPSLVCSCGLRLQEMGDILARIGVVSDTGWVGSSGGRCIVDFARHIKFHRRPSLNEMTLILEFFRRKDCPGWTEIKHAESAVLPCTWVFSTTMDSSD